MTAPLLSVRGVKTFYGRVMALKGVDLDVNDGEIVTLIGANGAGKSTLMMTICGNPRAREGSIAFAGHDITQLPTHEIARLKLAQAPEGRRIFSRMTVLENLQMGATIAEPAEFDRDLERVLTLFPRLKQRIGQRGGTLSGGEQQMLAIARALMARPRLLLLDEPSLGLAPLIVRQIFDAIKALNAAGRPHRVPGRAERLSRAQARAPRLCHGQRADHAVRARGANCWSGRRSSRPISKAAAHDRPSPSPNCSTRKARSASSCWSPSSSAAGRRRCPAAPSPPTWRPWWQVVAYSFILGLRRALHPFQPVRRHPAVGSLLSGRQRGLHGLRIPGLSGRPRGADGHAISLDQRAGRPAALAPQAALT